MQIVSSQVSREAITTFFIFLYFVQLCSKKSMNKKQFKFILYK